MNFLKKIIPKSLKQYIKSSSGSYDHALYQSDFLFIKQDHQIRASTRWI